MQELIQAVLRAAPDTQVKVEEPLRAYTSFQIGGPAELMLIPRTVEDLARVVAAVTPFEVPLHVLSGGSNLLIPDAGVRGVVLQVGCGSMRTLENHGLFAGAGCRKSAVSLHAAKEGLSGLEFLYGIPGTIGGGVFMNAGAYGGEMSQVVESVTACDRSGGIYTFGKDALDFSYRHSIFSARRDLVILGAVLKLSPKPPEEIRGYMDDIMSRRKEKQPLEYPSAGSTFKRPAGYFAGKLIEDCGLKGASVGGAQVSPKHAGFIVNTGGASCADVRRLIELVQQTVLRQCGVNLECEVEMW